MISLHKFLPLWVSCFTLYGGGGGGGDGGAAARKAAEDKRVAEAITRINQAFGISAATPAAVNRADYIISSTPATGFAGLNGWGTNKNQTSTIFDEAGYNAAVAAANAEAAALNNRAEDREKLYTKIGDDATNVAMRDLNKDRAVTERDLGFMLARAGLTGGSRDVDVNRDILDTYQQGVLKAANTGTQIGNNARSADDQTRVSLVNAVTGGLDAGSALQQSYEGMANNARAAQDEANANSLVGFFDVLKNTQQNAAYTQGQSQAAQAYQSPYTRRSSGSYNGSVIATN